MGHCKHFLLHWTETLQQQKGFFISKSLFSLLFWVLKITVHISYYIVQHFIAMDCHYCQNMKLLYENEKNTVHRNKLKEKFQNSFFCPTFSFSFVIQWRVCFLALRAHNRGGIKVLEIREWISEWVLPASYLKKYCHVLCILCVSPPVWNYSGQNNSEFLLQRQPSTNAHRTGEERNGKGCFSWSL